MPVPVSEVETEAVTLVVVVLPARLMRVMLFVSLSINVGRGGDIRERGDGTSTTYVRLLGAAAAPETCMYWFHSQYQ